MRSFVVYCQDVEQEQPPPIRNRNLSDSYNQRFKVVRANTSTLLDQAYRLRYQVYCRECHYETPEAHPQELETDEFDRHSVHSLVVDRATDAAIGTVRLILPDQKAPETSFPIQQICSHSMLADLFLTSTSAELSRFAISKKIRKTACSFIPGVTGRDEDRPVNRSDPKCSIVLGLMKASLQMSFKHDITDWFAVMEPALLRLLSRFSIYFKPIGPLVEYHGVRQPCYANVGALLERVRQERFDLWEFVTESGGTFL